MAETVKSKSGVLIRLSEERWEHIVTEHSELSGMHDLVLEAIGNPERILSGGAGEHLAVLEIQRGKWLVVAYREVEQDGFVITSFVTTRLGWIGRRRQIWP